MTSPPNTLITLYVDPSAKGSAVRRIPTPGHAPQYIAGSWVAIVMQGDTVKHLRLYEARDRSDAERMVREHLNIPRRKLVWVPTSADQVAWKTSTRL